MYDVYSLKSNFVDIIWIGFEVLTAVVMKNSVFWDLTLCSPFKVNQHFGRTCRLHLQGRRISQERNQYKADSKQSRFNAVWFMLDATTLKMEATFLSETKDNLQWATPHSPLVVWRWNFLETDVILYPCFIFFVQMTDKKNSFLHS
jgi:hypothetical protein